MEKFYYEVPSIARKEDAIDYIEEFNRFGSEVQGAGCLQRYLDNYEGWLDFLEKDKRIIPSEEDVPTETFFLVRESDNKIVGMTNIRTGMNTDWSKWRGHIGFSIRPTERRKEYNKINFYLALEKCQEFGIENAILTCKDDNVGSYKTMESFGVIPEEYQYDDFMVKRYIIPVDETLKEYEDAYSQSGKKQR